MSSLSEGGMESRSYADVPEDRDGGHRPGDSGPPPPEAARRLGSLISTLEGEIIPRLVLVHRAPSHSAADDRDPAHAKISEEDVKEFTRLVVSHDADVAMAYCRALGAKGISVAVLYLELLTPVARRLGKMWETDECGFTEVTLGLCRLHQVLRALAPEFRGAGASKAESRRALLLPAPGEQHMFGVVMVAEFFRRAGWDVRSGPSEGADDLVALVRKQWFSLVGLSVSTERGLDALPRVIERMRRASRNRSAAIFVGGHVFREDPGLAEKVGADGTGSDARTAALHAENLLATME